MAVGGVEETITVTGAAPIVDVQGVQEQQVFSGDTVLALPIGKNQGIYVTLIPAATQGNLANQDVGGTKGENTQIFAVHGGRAAETYQLRDGVYFGEHIGNAANFAASVNPAIVQEVAVQTTGGLTADAQSGGVIINVISRDGGNELHGVMSADFGTRGLQANNISDDLRARGATLTGTLRHLYDVAFGVGGPLKRDRALVLRERDASTSPPTSRPATTTTSRRIRCSTNRTSRVRRTTATCPRTSASASRGRRRRSTRSPARIAMSTTATAISRSRRGSSRPRRPATTGTRRCSRARGRGAIPRPTGCCSRPAACFSAGLTAASWATRSTTTTLPSSIG